MGPIVSALEARLKVNVLVEVTRYLPLRRFPHSCRHLTHFGEILRIERVTRLRQPPVPRGRDEIDVTKSTSSYHAQCF